MGEERGEAEWALVEFAVCRLVGGLRRRRVMDRRADGGAAKVPQPGVSAGGLVGTGAREQSLCVRGNFGALHGCKEGFQEL